MALTADRPTAQKDGIDFPVPVAAATILYAGSLVCADADGFAVPAADTAGLKFLGMALKHVDNSAGANGDKTITVRAGMALRLKGSSLAQAQVGDSMYAVDDETVAAVGVTTNDVLVGTLHEFISATEGWVKT
jgi:hypothetical protein